MMPQNSVPPLVAIKLVHTLIWAFFAGAILGLPAAAWAHRFDWAVVLTALVLIECLVLALNRGSCPLTSLAARFSLCLNCLYSGAGLCTQQFGPVM